MCTAVLCIDKHVLLGKNCEKKIQSLGYLSLINLHIIITLCRISDNLQYDVKTNYQMSRMFSSLKITVSMGAVQVKNT